MVRRGFTGTQKGMTTKQKTVLEHMLFPVLTLDNGFCIGADEECLRIFDEIASRSSTPRVVHAHIPLKKNKMTKFVPQCGVVWHEPLDYMARNENIVVEQLNAKTPNAGGLIATPGEVTEQLRSGTWSTIRRARTYKIPYEIIRPNGDVFGHMWNSLGQMLTGELSYEQVIKRFGK